MDLDSMPKFIQSFKAYNKVLGKGAFGFVYDSKWNLVKLHVDVGDGDYFKN